jgi:hypothetical protein
MSNPEPDAFYQAPDRGRRGRGAIRETLEQPADS